MNAEQRTDARIWIFSVSAGALVVAAGLLQQSAYRGSTQLHTVMEVAATLLALVVGFVALVWFYSRKNNASLFVSMGFLGTALLDGYHTIVTSTFFHVTFPSSPPSLIPWSWNASRTFLSILMFLSWWAWRREQKLGKAGTISAHAVQAAVAVLTVASFCFFAFVPLPRAYYPEFFFGRPEEFLAAAFFLAALVGYAHKGDWQQNAFEFWVMLSLLVGVICQAAVMSRSFVLFDAMFDMAHMLKFVSYACVLVGLLIGIYDVDRQSVESQRKAELAEEHLRLVIKSAPHALVMINQRREIILVNSALLKLFGYSKEELLNEPIEKLIPQQHRETHPQQVANFFADGESRQLAEGRDLRAVRSDGQELFVEITVSLLQTPEGAVAIGSLADVTGRKRAAEVIARKSQQLKLVNRALESTNAELEQFAYVASHDLQEPLRKVAACCQTLSEDYADKLDEDGREWIAFAVAGATRMRQLVKDLLEFSRVNRLGQDPEPTDAHQACETALGNLTDAIEHRDAQLICRPLPVVLVDGGRLIQLFQNLIGNSIKYCNQEQPVVEIGAEPGDGEWTFYVKDNGIGIAPEFRERIFQIFQRLHSREEYEGTGIGLAICKKVVEASGGRLWVESQVGHGSTFYFTLPTAESITKEARDDNDIINSETKDDHGTINSGTVDASRGDFTG